MARTMSVTIKNLPEIRKELNLTQQQFADRLNSLAPGLQTIQQTVDKWEHGAPIHPATAVLIRQMAKGGDPANLG